MVKVCLFMSTSVLQNITDTFIFKDFTINQSN